MRSHRLSTRCGPCSAPTYSCAGSSHHPDASRRPGATCSRATSWTLLVERGLEPAFDVVVTVRARPDVRVARLAADRGMPEADARARMAAQVSDEERERAAHVVLDNDGSWDELEVQVDELWRDLSRPAAGPA